MYKANEIRKNEIFLGNTDKDIRPDLAHIKSLRLGKVALDIYGKVLPGYRPMFVQRGEDFSAYDRAMEARLSAIRRG